RLQVEHPVTEFITGIDLVKEQIKIARGEKLSFEQNDIELRGHSIELRVYAEDPNNNFLPDIGKLKLYKRPQGNGVRVDDGYDEGMNIPIYYDPMIAKLVTYGQNRQEAIERMKRAIDEYRIIGIETTLPFGKFVMETDSFISGNYNTHFVQDYFDPQKLNVSNDDEPVAAIIMANILNQEYSTSDYMPHKTEFDSKWRKNRL
ncbi:MAG: biotin carboxylase, partial [Bacteroidetes bacterium]